MYEKRFTNAMKLKVQVSNDKRKANKYGTNIRINTVK